MWLPRGRWAWTDRHLKQKVINPHTHTDRRRRRTGRQSETQCNSTLVGPHYSSLSYPLPSALACRLPLPFCWRPSTHLHKTHPQLGSRRNFSAFLLFPSCFFHHFCFLRFHIGALRVPVDGRGGSVVSGEKVVERRWHWGSLRVLFLCRHEN